MKTLTEIASELSHLKIGDAILNAPEPTEIMTAHIHQLLIDLDSFLTDEHPIKHSNSYKYLKSKI